MDQPQWGKRLSKFFILPQRIILSLMALFAGMVAYTMRVCISMAIIVMVVKKEHEEQTGELVCPMDPDQKKHEHEDGGDYTWSEAHQGLILSAFYFGYVVSHIPAGLYCDAYGGKWPLIVGIFSSSVLSMVSPLATRFGGSYTLIGIRILMGCAQGFIYPSLSVLISRWVPKNERASLGVIILSGAQVGNIFGNSMSGYLLHNYVWDVTFYFFGILGVVWCITFALLCYSDPRAHPFIKESEIEYLDQELGTHTGKKDLLPTPWLAIMTNAPMIALIIAQFGHDWGFFAMVSDLPKYMGDVLHVPIEKDGIYSSLPYLAMLIVSCISGIFTDWIIKKDYISITNARKIMTSIAAFGPAIFIVAASYAGCDQVLSVACFVIAMGTMGTFVAGMKLGSVDMSPNYAGTLMAISNGLGAIAGILAPYINGVLTPHYSLEEWRLVFWLAFIVLFVTCVIYIIWASGEIQPFDAQN